MAPKISGPLLPPRTRSASHRRFVASGSYLAGHGLRDRWRRTPLLRTRRRDTVGRIARRRRGSSRTRSRTRGGADTGLSPDLSGSARHGAIDVRWDGEPWRRGRGAGRVHRPSCGHTRPAVRPLLWRIPGTWAGRPAAVRGLALVCPFFADGTSRPPALRALVDEPDAYDELEDSDRAGFEGYFVIRTRATARRYRDAVAPGTTLVDPDALGRIFAQWSLPVESEPFSRPTLIVAGHHDSTAGYVDAAALLDRYPGATLAVLDNAGHALIHEQPDALSSLLHDWVARVRRHDAHDSAHALQPGAGPDQSTREPDCEESSSSARETTTKATSGTRRACEPVAEVALRGVEQFSSARLSSASPG